MYKSAHFSIPYSNQNSINFKIITYLVGKKHHEISLIYNYFVTSACHVLPICKFFFFFFCDFFLLVYIKRYIFNAQYLYTFQIDQYTVRNRTQTIQLQGSKNSLCSDKQTREADMTPFTGEQHNFGNEPETHSHADWHTATLIASHIRLQTCFCKKLRKHQGIPFFF